MGTLDNIQQMYIPVKFSNYYSGHVRNNIFTERPNNINEDSNLVSYVHIFILRVQ